MRATLQDAWRQVLCDPESLLPELLAEKVKEISGYLPDRETVAEFLQGVSGGGSTADPPQDIVVEPNKRVRESRDMGELTRVQRAYLAFWSEFLPAFRRQHPGLSRARTISKSSGISFSAGKADLRYWVSFCRSESRYRFRLELHIDAKNPEEATRRFRDLQDRQTEIEAAYGDKLEWEGSDKSRGYRIASYYPEDVRVRNRERWSDLRTWALSRIGPFKRALQPHIDASP